jgi:hypothetical protein
MPAVAQDRHVQIKSPTTVDKRTSHDLIYRTQYMSLSFKRTVVMTVVLSLTREDSIHLSSFLQGDPPQMPAAADYYAKPQEKHVYIIHTHRSALQCGQYYGAHLPVRMHMSLLIPLKSF